jgi:hypothetical protein
MHSELFKAVCPSCLDFATTFASVEVAGELARDHDRVEHGSERVTVLISESGIVIA